MHERLGSALSGPGASIAGLASPAQAASELLGFGVLGAAFAWFLISALGSSSGRERAIGARVAGLVALLALFGAVVDLAGGALVAAGAADLAGAVGGQLQGALATPLPLGLSDGLPFPLGLARLGSAVLGSEAVVHALLELRLTKVVTTVVEEGGEMVCISMLLAHLAGVLSTGRPAPGTPLAEAVAPARDRVGR